MPPVQRGLVQMGFDPEAAEVVAKILMRGRSESFGAYLLRPVDATRDVTDVIVGLVEAIKGLVPVAEPPTTMATFRYLIDQGILDPGCGLLYRWAEGRHDVIGDIARRAITEDTPEALEAGLRAVAAGYIQEVRKLFS